MTYNNDLQTNNTSLQSILDIINDFPPKDSLEIQEWEFTLENDTVIKKYVEAPPKYINIEYDLNPKTTSSNTITKIKFGNIYKTILTLSVDTGYIASVHVYFKCKNTNKWEQLTGIHVEKSAYELTIDTSILPIDTTNIRIETIYGEDGIEEW